MNILLGIQDDAWYEKLKLLTQSKLNLIVELPKDNKIIK